MTERAFAPLLSALAAALATSVSGTERAPAADGGPDPADRESARVRAALDEQATTAILPTLATALRQAAIDALRLCLDVYAANQRAGRRVASDAFLPAAHAFCERQTRIVASRGAAWRPESWVPGGLPGSTFRSDATVAPRLETRDAMRRAIEQALLTEIDVDIGPVLIPDAFLRLAQEHGGRSTGWFDAFTLYAVAAVLREPALGPLLGPPVGQLPPTAVRALLERLGRDIALRFDERLERPQPARDETASVEVPGYLARLPNELAAACDVPEAAVRRVQRRLIEQGISPLMLEARLVEPIGLLRLAATFARGPSLAVLLAVRHDVMRHIAQGRFDVALSVLDACPLKDAAPGFADNTGNGSAHSNGSGEANDHGVFATDTQSLVRAELAWASGLCEALRGDPVSAIEHIEQALVMIAGTSPRAERRYRLTLANVLASMRTAEETRRAVALYGEIAAEEAPGETGDILLPAALGLAETVQRLGKPQRHIRWSTLAAQVLRRLTDTTVPALPARQRAQVWLALADVAALLTRLGAERRDEMREALRSAVSLAREAGDVRLACQAHFRLADSLAAATADAADEDAARAAVVSALTAAQVPGLRLRDPMLWATVKLRMGEALVAQGSDDAGSATAVASGIVALKAALRILTPGIDATARNRIATDLGEAFMRLARHDRRELWRRHALEAFAASLDGISPDSQPQAFADTHLRIAAALVGPDLDNQELPTLETAIGHYRSAARALQPPANRWAQARRLLADTLTVIGRRRFDLDQLEQACAIHRETLSATEAADMPNIHAQCWIGLSAALRELARLTSHVAPLAGPLAQLEALEPDLAERGPQWLLLQVRAAIRDGRRLLPRTDAPADAQADAQADARVEPEAAPEAARVPDMRNDPLSTNARRIFARN